MIDQPERIRKLEVQAERLGFAVEPTPGSVLAQRHTVKPDWVNRRSYAARRVAELVAQDPGMSAGEVLQVLEMEAEAAELGVDLI